MAEELVKVLQKVATENSDDAWSDFLLSWYATIGQPRTKSKKGESLSTVIRRNIAEKHTAEQNCALEPAERQKRSDGDVAKAVNRKLQDGNVSGAVKMLAEEVCVSAASTEVLQSLLEKHPSNEPIDEKHFTVTADTISDLTTDEIADAVRTFPGGSAGGLDSMRPCYLKELLVARGQAGGSLLRALSSVIVVMLQGKVPSSIIPVLYGASLFPLAKKDGGIRPIAVGCTLRRLVSKIVSKRSRHLSSLLQPVQLGFATTNGCETAVHAARHFVESRLDTAKVHAFLKVDVRNAFNCLDRNAILDLSRQHLPLYHPYIAQCYGSTSFLLCEENVIQSRSGIQQGDPLGPLLYCLAKIDAHRILKSALKESYLDDDVLADELEIVLEDFICLENRLQGLGLTVNVEKCELFLFGGSEAERLTAYRRFLEKFPLLPRVTAGNLCYLGSPLLDDGFISEFEKTSAKVLVLIRKTSILPAHQAYFLVKSCLGPVKLVYLLRTTRGFRFLATLHNFDESMRVALASIFNTNLSGLAWSQATLPISFGGIGIRLTEGLALPAFLASAHSVRGLVQLITPFSLEKYLGGAVEKWTDLAACQPPVLEALGTQKCWDLLLAQVTFAEIGRNLEADPTTIARLKAVRTQESSAWLSSLPSSRSTPC